jgi:hypothetical protein
MDGDLIYAAVHRVKARLGSFPLGIHLVGEPVHRRLQTIILRRQGYVKKQDWLEEKKMIRSQIRIKAENPI